MKFHETSLSGVYLIEPELLEDERGFFARSFCTQEFEKNRLISEWVQCNISFNKKKGTLRGMHYQISPYEEGKLVRCTMGSIFDVIIDLRPNSQTYKQHTAFELTASNRLTLFIPPGLAHGFQTLENNTEVFYHMSKSYHPASARGIRWNDPSFSINWPLEEKIISPKDQIYPDLIL